MWLSSLFFKTFSNPLFVSRFVSVLVVWHYFRSLSYFDLIKIAKPYLCLFNLCSSALYFLFDRMALADNLLSMFYFGVSISLSCWRKTKIRFRFLGIILTLPLADQISGYLFHCFIIFNHTLFESKNLIFFFFFLSLFVSTTSFALVLNFI